MRHWRDNRIIARTPLGAECAQRYGAPYYTFHRADLHRANRILREKLQPELAFLDVAKDPQDVPLGPTGKVLKRVLRERYKNLFAGGRSEYASGYVPDLMKMGNAASDTSRVDH